MNKREVALVKRDLANAFLGLNFNEEKHHYSYKGRTFLSTSSYIKRFYQPFNSVFMAQKVAEKYNRINPGENRSAKYYLERWELMAQQATTSGHRVHAYLELNYPEFYEPPSCEQELGGIHFYDDLPDKYEVIFLELRMMLKQYRRSGTADIIILNKETGNIIIADWKTNKRNLLQYYNNQKLKTPFNNLKATALNKYSLQLSDYQNMIELNTKYKVEARWIIHLSDNDHKKLDLSKRGEPDKYQIDNIEPDYIGNGYKLYKLKDYSKIIRKDYDILAAKGKTSIENKVKIYT
jgi:hypothetical protein